MQRKYLALLLVIVLFLSACSGGGGVKEESPNAGMWKGHSISIWGLEEPIESYYPGGFNIELYTGGRGSVTINETSEDAIWTLKDGYFTLKWDNKKVSGIMLEGNKIVLEELQGTGSNAIFYKEGTQVPELVQAPEAPSVSSVETPVEPVEVQTPASVETPEEPPEVETPEEPQEVETPLPEEVTLSPGTWWEGFILTSDRTGSFEYPDQTKVVAFIGVDTSTNRPFFEIYAGEKRDDVVVSMYIETTETGDTFKAVIGEKDAWIFDHYIEPEEAELFDGSLLNGTINYVYQYQEEGATAQIIIWLTPQGTLE